MNNNHKLRDYLHDRINDYKYGSISAKDFCEEASHFILSHPLFIEDDDLTRAIEILKPEIHRFYADAPAGENAEEPSEDTQFWLALKDVYYLLQYGWTFSEEREEYFENGMQRDDPVVYTDEYLAIEPEMERLVHEETGDGGYMGFCHTYWQTKKTILKERFGIEWKSPAERYPGIIFD